MKTELQTAEELIKEYQLDRGLFWKTNCRTHKQTCQRFLEFLEEHVYPNGFHACDPTDFEDGRACSDCTKAGDKITDLKNAIKEYEDNGI